MPNITLYLDDKIYRQFVDINLQSKKKIKQRAINIIIKMLEELEER